MLKTEFVSYLIYQSSNKILFSYDEANEKIWVVISENVNILNSSRIKINFLINISFLSKRRKLEWLQKYQLKNATKN